tara:strand:- start:522 stop:782 length:261 start_codon:yes stop_codon:yes gene_type:complete
MSRFGDLLGGVETVVTPITTPQPVVETPVKVEKVSEFPQIYTKQDLMKMTKIELEEVGRTYGIELDRRLTHAKLVVQLKAFIDSKS